MKDTLIKTLAETMTINPVDGGSADDLPATINNIITAIVGILGLACVIIVIIGGIQYMTSSGDAGKVKKAKDTILYGVIGMVICVLAYAITAFIISAINGK